MPKKDFFKEKGFSSSNEDIGSTSNPVPLADSVKTLPIGIIYRKHCEGTLKNVLDTLSMIDDHLLIDTNLDVDTIYSSSKNIAISIASSGVTTIGSIKTATITDSGSSGITVKDSAGNVSLKIGASLGLIQTEQIQPIDDRGGEELEINNTWGAVCMITAGDSDGRMWIDAIDNREIKALSTSGLTIKTLDGNTYIKMKDGYGVSIGATPTVPYSGNHPTIQLGALSVILSDSGDLHLSVNSSFDGSDWKYISNGTASVFVVRDTVIEFYKAASGNAGDVISWGAPVWTAP